MKLLIVDDHPRMRALLRRLLARPDREFIECGDGAEAVAACAAHQPDWVLMDLRMPGLDGLAATGQIKSAQPQTRIIVVTNHGDVELRAEAAALGVSGYVLKDRLEELAALLGEHAS